jgi:hypothetical protein
MSTATCTPDVQGPSTATAPNVAQDSSPAATQAGSESCPTKRGASRDAKGRFGPGNLGGPGNPFARQLAKFRAFIMTCNTEEHMRFAFNKMMAMIADGNLGALKLYFLYILGKPADAVDPDKLDFDEWEGYKATANMMDEATALMKAPASDLPLTMLRIGKAANTQLMRDFAVHNLEHPEEMEKAKAEAARKKKEEMEKALKKLDEPATAVWPGLPTAASSMPAAGNGRQPSTNGGNGQGHVAPLHSARVTDPADALSENLRSADGTPAVDRSPGSEIRVERVPSTNGSNGHDPRGSQSLTPRLEAEQPSTNGGDGAMSPAAYAARRAQTTAHGVCLLLWPPLPP